MPSFSTSLSGLTANSQALSVIANNLANLNTIAFKTASPIFRDLYYQNVGSSGSGNPLQIGVGTLMGSLASQFSQGNIESTGNSTDVAVQGEGFFVVDHQGKRLYTRAGNFSISPDGLLVSDDGAHVMGYTAVNGVINTNQALGPLTISSGQVSLPIPTSKVQISMNLDAGAAVGDTFSTAAAVYDSLGASHVLNYTFTKSAAGSWTYTITIPAADVGGTGNPVQVATGTLTFDSSGQLTAPASDVTGISVSNLANGASALGFTWQLYDSAGASLVTQLAGPSAASSTRQNGLAAGTLLSFAIQGDGTILGIFSNGQTAPLGQLALATFPNVQGLLRDGANGFVAGLSSGAANIGVPGTGGRGTVFGGALERSNVDIAREFAQLILAQRGYQANARAITTADELTVEALNLKR